MIIINGIECIGLFYESEHEFAMLGSTGCSHSIFNEKIGQQATFVRSDTSDDGTCWDVYRVQKCYSIKKPGCRQITHQD